MPDLFRSALLEVPPQLAYEVVVDVARYPEFLPMCAAVSVLEEQVNGLVARVAVAGAGFSETFITTNSHVPGESVSMSLREGPFDYLEGQWTFAALGDIGCRIELHISYAPSGVIARLLTKMADRVANKMVDAFSERIASLHQR